MSRHQAVRNLDYHQELDEFEAEGYSDEEELGAEDKALMRQGTLQVQEILGVGASKVTTAQIEEALWHYYYDVDKAVAFLVTKYIVPPEPKQVKGTPQKTTSEFRSPFSPQLHSALLPGIFDQYPPCTKGRMATCSPGRADATLFLRFLRDARTSLTHGQGDEFLRQSRPNTPPGFELRPRGPYAHLFLDMPWGNVPKHRQTLFIEPPKLPGGLLGGSGAPPKLSKLQQLAAARKKKVEEKQSEEKVEGVRTKMSDLGLNSSLGKKENIALGGGPNKRQKTAEATPPSSTPSLGRDRRQQPVHEPMDVDDAGKDAASDPRVELRVVLEDASVVPPAAPSAFAKTLFGSPSNAPTVPQRDFFALPFASHPAVQGAFSGPSPDDVVFAAQAKGSLSGKGKH